MVTKKFKSSAEMLSAMIVLAAVKHDGQFDKGGRPYILHPMRVMYKIKSEDDELQAICVGHDLIEDTDVTAQSLRDMGFSERVIAGIVCLTKVHGEETQVYKNRVFSNIDSIKVKIQDLQHNSDIRRLKGVTDKDIRRMEGYQKFYTELKEREMAWRYEPDQQLKKVQHPDMCKPVMSLRCTCCGGSSQGRQFHNQDIGFGLGDCCVDYVTPRVEDMARTYGLAGVHYNLEVAPLA